MTDELYEIHVSYYRGPSVALRSFEPYATKAFEEITYAIDMKAVRITVQLDVRSTAAIFRLDDIATVIVLPAYDSRIVAATIEHQKRHQEQSEDIPPQRPPGTSLS